MMRLAHARRAHAGGEESMTVKLVEIAGSLRRGSFNADGELVDAAARDNLAKFLAGFVDYARR